MNFVKYQHLERFGQPATQGIENGTCYVFPKIDGCNGSIWCEGDKLCFGSRNRPLLWGEKDNQGFRMTHTAPVNAPKFHQLFEEHPCLRLFGEWLVPHTLKTYNKDAWRKFYVFDVMIDDNKYLSYEVYQPVLERYGIEYIPPICKINNPTYETLVGFLEQNTYLIEEGKGIGEGIVIKNYSYQNKRGEKIWAKIIDNEYKAKTQNKIAVVQERVMVEEDIVRKYVTSHLIEKEYAKIINEIEWTSKMIPRLLNVVFYSLINEESWNIVKEFKNPTIDYKRLQFFTVNKIKETKPELF